MPWARAKLKGQSVWARATTEGELVAEGGRVEVRYNPKDGRAYRAALRNLEKISGSPVEPDDFCAEALPEAAPSATANGNGATTRPSSAKRSAAAAATTAVSIPEEDAEYIAYTDGACSGNPGPAGCGMLLSGPGGMTKESYAYLGIATNNVAELTAVLLAVEGTPKDAKSVLVLTDSKYAIGVLSMGWKAKANQELIARIRAVLAERGRTVRMKYVPGHAGVPGNERADELARTAIQQRASLPFS